MRVLVALFFVLMTSQASAVVSYTYTGNFFTTIDDSSPPVGTYDNSMRISGIFDLANPLAANTSADITADVLDFSFFDGRNTLTKSDLAILGPDDTAFQFFFIQTDASGQIEQWNVVLNLQREIDSPSYKGIFMSTENIFGGLDPQDVARLENNSCSGGGCTIVRDRAIAQGAGGWTSDQTPSSVDEPSSTLGLLALGLCCIPYIRSRRRSAQSG